MAESNSKPSSTMIRIYPSFTEIRQNVNAKSPHQIYIPQDLFHNIIEGSLNLEGVDLKSMESVLRENNVEGKEIHVFRNKELRKVKMIRSRDSLVQDLETNRFYNVDRNQIEYSEIPEETGTEVTFIFDKEGPGVLSYLMSGISWKPRYSFNVQGDTNTFQGWADIRNDTMKEYSIDKTELFGGDVSIRQPRHYRAEAMMLCAKSSRAYNSDVAVESEGEVAGLYMYSIKNAYSLSPRSTFSLPFAAPTIEMKRIAIMRSYFNHTNSKGQSERVYKIKSSEFLPAGTVTVREDGRVVGQSSISDLSADEFANLNVGSDPEISYQREVKTIVHNKDMSQYEVQVTIKNKKERNITYEFSENFGGRFEIQLISDNVTIENDRVKTEGELDSKQSTSVKFGIRFFYRD